MLFLMYFFIELKCLHSCYIVFLNLEFIENIMFLKKKHLFFVLLTIFVCDSKTLKIFNLFDNFQTII